MESVVNLGENLFASLASAGFTISKSFIHLHQKGVLRPPSQSCLIVVSKSLGHGIMTALGCAAIACCTHGLPLQALLWPF